MKTKLIGLNMILLLGLLSSCQSENITVAPAIKVIAGETALSLYRGKKNIVTDVVIDGKNYTTKRVVGDNVFINFSTSKFDNKYQSKLKYNNQELSILKENTNTLNFVDHKYEINSYNLVYGEENGTFSFTITAGTNPYFLGEDIHNFSLKNVFLTIGENKIYSVETGEATDEIFFGERTQGKTRYLEKTFSFNIDSSYFNEVGTIVDNFDTEKEIIVSYENIDYSIKNVAKPKLQVNISEGERVTSAKIIDVNYGNNSECLLFLDGVSIDNHFALNPLAWNVGKHTLEINAFSTNGFYEKKSISFFLEEAILVVKEKPVDVYYFGAVDTLPEKLDYSVGKKADVSLFLAQDEAIVKSNFGKVSYQLIKMKKEADNAIKVSGVVPSGRTIVLEVYDHSLNKFIPVSTGKCLASTFTVGAVIDEKYAFEGYFDLRIYSQTAEALKADINESIGWITDTQNITRIASLSSGNTKGVLALNSVRDELINAYKNNKMKYFAMTGDIVQKTDEELEWIAFKESFLDGVVEEKVPFGFTGGNHDVGGLSALCNPKLIADGKNPIPDGAGNECPDEYLDYSYYSKYFGDKLYKDIPTYGQKFDSELGSFNNSKSHFDLVDIAGSEYLFLYITWGYTEGGIHVSPLDVAWAKKVLSKYTSQKVVLLTHEYVSITGGKTKTGTYLFDQLVKPYKNIEFVLSGHINGSAGHVSYLDDDNDGLNDRRVYQLLTDLQEEESKYGATFIRYMNFLTKTDQIVFSLYSPYLKDYEVEYVDVKYRDIVYNNNVVSYAYDFQKTGFGIGIDKVN